jgi:hypothetical protein
MAGAIGPIDYSTGADSPLAAFNQGFQSAANVVQTQQAQQQAQLALNTQQQMSRDVAQVSQNPTPQAIAQLAVKYPSLSEHFGKSFSMVDQAQKDQRLNAAVPIYAAVNSDNPDVAINLLNKQADALEAAGKTQEAQSSRDMAKLVQSNPQAAKLNMGLALAAVGGTDKFSSMFPAVGKEARDNALAPATVAKAGAEATKAQAEAAVAPQAAVLANRNIQSQIAERSARLGLDQDKLTSEMQVKMEELKVKQGLNALPDARKLVNDSVQSSVLSNATAEKYNTLANGLEQAGTQGNFAGRGWDAFRSMTGIDGGNELKNLKMEFNRLRAQGLATSMPGVTRMTDNDIKIASKGFPDADAPLAQVTGFLRGVAKMQQIDAATNAMKADWANSVGSLGKPKQDINVQGVTVQAGMNFADFQKQFVGSIVNKFSQQANTKTVQERDYMQHANPEAQ